MRNIQSIIGIITLLIVLLASGNIRAQDAQIEKAEVKKVIETLFDGMRTGDSTMVSSAFTKDAIMKTIGNDREGNLVVHDGSLDKFLQAVASPKEQVWDEKITSYEIKVDAELASAWTPYEFYLGEQFSHCGVNSFQLAKLEGEWKIFFIVDTRRKDNCVY